MEICIKCNEVHSAGTPCKTANLSESDAAAGSAFTAFADKCKWRNIYNTWVGCKAQTTQGNGAYNYCTEKNCALFDLMNRMRF